MVVVNDVIALVNLSARPKGVGRNRAIKAHDLISLLNKQQFLELLEDKTRGLKSPRYGRCF